MAAQHFVDAEDGYLGWVSANPDGFVINRQRWPSASYIVLHRASCGTITSAARTNYTTHAYAKTCSSSR